MNAQAGFFTRLTALASMANFVLTEEVIELYDRMLSPGGYDSLCLALDKIILERSSRDPFPSIKEISEKLDIKISDADQAVFQANRILSSVSRFGWNNSTLARNHLGENAWKVVHLMGGWEKLCQSITLENIGMFRAQMRDLYKAAQSAQIQENTLTYSGIMKTLEERRDHGQEETKAHQETKRLLMNEGAYENQECEAKGIPRVP
jgi:hypothetical protein